MSSGPHQVKTTEEVIKVYLKNVYSTSGGSTHILSDGGGEFTSKQSTLLVEELEFIKVYTSPHTPTGNSVIECTHSFLKGSLQKLICNHNIDWDE